MGQHYATRTVAIKWRNTNVVPAPASGTANTVGLAAVAPEPGIEVPATHPTRGQGHEQWDDRCSHSRADCSSSNTANKAPRFTATFSAKRLTYSRGTQAATRNGGGKCSAIRSPT